MNYLKEKISLSKTVITTIWITFLCHSLCCVFPLFAIIFGINFFGHLLHEYEGVFISLNLISIIIGFYVTYIHKSKKNCDHKSCHKTNKGAYWLATAISLSMLFLIH